MTFNTRVIGRVLVCTVCHASVDVCEAKQGARSEAAHRWIVPADYVCGDCPQDGLGRAGTSPEEGS